MDTTELEFENQSVSLAGSLRTNGSTTKSPGVLLISGSGPLDRDSNMKRMAIDVSKQIADHLADAGLVTFRYDKRGVGASTGDYESTGFYDNVADAEAALDTLRARPEVDARNVFVVGHSEGALIATELAAKNPGLSGVVLLAGSARNGEEVLRWQASQVAETLPRLVKLILKVTRQDVLSSQAKRLEQLKASEKDAMRVGLAKMNARWFREFMTHDPAESLMRVSIPVLAVVGTKDLQVPPADSQRICELVLSDCSPMTIEDMTHILRTDPGEASLRTYKEQIKRPVEPELLALLTSWMSDLVLTHGH